MNIFRPVSLCLVIAMGFLTTITAESPRMDRTDLLQYPDSSGKIQPVTSSEDWQKRRMAIVQGMQSVMGTVPDNTRRVPLDIKILESHDAGSYLRQLITYQSEPESRTPAYLCIPKTVLSGKQTAPAVLCLHPTDNVVGHKVVLGLGGRAGRQYAAELAERGYVTLSPSYPHLANYWPNLSALGYVSGSMKAVWDNMRGLDLLASLPYVNDKYGFGAIGHSLGGHNAIYTAVLDMRISVIASSCGFDSYLDYYDGARKNWFFEKGWCQIRYMPRLSDYRDRLEKIPFDFQELLGALAPRPFYINAPLHDNNFRWKSVDQCVAAAQPIYTLLGHPENLVVDHPDSDHNFPVQQREQAYQIIDSTLRPETD